MKASEYLKGQFLKKEDVLNGPVRMLVTEVEAVEVEFKDGKEERLQLVLDDEKRLTLNTTNLKTMIRLFGDDTAGWIGTRLVVYWDENVMFKGNSVGGIRLRAVAKPQPKPAPRPVVHPQPEKDEGEGSADFDYGANLEEQEA